MVYLLRTLSGGGPMSTWGRSSQLCSASLPLNPLATMSTGHSSTTVEWNSNYLVGTLITEVTVQTFWKHSLVHTMGGFEILFEHILILETPHVWFYLNRQLWDKLKWGDGAKNQCGRCMEWIITAVTEQHTFFPLWHNHCTAVIIKTQICISKGLDTHLCTWVLSIFISV